MKTYEYVEIQTGGGKPQAILPVNAETKTAFDAGETFGTIGAINKLGEQGFRLLEGTFYNGGSGMAIGGANVAYYMVRENEA